jgi:Ca-activated chloride channel family protein
VTITIPEGIRPVRVLGNEADINGQKIVTRIAQIYSEQERYLVLELEIPESAADSKRELARVEVSYTNLQTKAVDHQQATTSIAFSADEQAVAKSVNRDVMTDVVALISSEQNKLATGYLDAGNFAACRETLQKNAAFLATNSDRYAAPELKRLEQLNLDQLTRLRGVESKDAPAANFARKGMRFYQNSVDLQQKLAPASPTTPSSANPATQAAPRPQSKR